MDLAHCFAESSAVYFLRFRPFYNVILNSSGVLKSAGFQINFWWISVCTFIFLLKWNSYFQHLSCVVTGFISAWPFVQNSRAPLWREACSSTSDQVKGASWRQTASCAPTVGPQSVQGHSCCVAFPAALRVRGTRSGLWAGACVGPSVPRGLLALGHLDGFWLLCLLHLF